jgi:hypothetical protein
VRRGKTVALPSARVRECYGQVQKAWNTIFESDRRHWVGEERNDMKSSLSIAALMIFAFALFTGCATMPQTWPDPETGTETRIMVVQKKIGEGLQTGTLSSVQAEIYLTTLEEIITDYMALTDKDVFPNEWEKLNARINELGDEISRAPRLPREELFKRIVALQIEIGDEQFAGRLASKDWRKLQTKIDSIRRDYIRMTEGNRSTPYERADIARRLGSLERELHRYKGISQSASGQGG